MTKYNLTAGVCGDTLLVFAWRSPARLVEEVGVLSRVLGTWKYLNEVTVEVHPSLVNALLEENLNKHKCVCLLQMNYIPKGRYALSELLLLAEGLCETP